MPVSALSPIQAESCADRLGKTGSTVGNSLVSGLGGLLNFYIPVYAAAGKGYDDITHLLTYPALFM
jgi:hypothetical protein